MSNSVKSKANEFLREYKVKEISAQTLRSIIEKQGYTIVEYNDIINDSDVETLLASLKLKRFAERSKGFTYADDKHRLVFLHEDLSEKEKLKVIWSKEDSISYDCTDLFIHKASITYGSETVEVELKDYQTNYFDLSELFSNYDVKKLHNISLQNSNQDGARIQEKEGSKDGLYTCAKGAILRLFTWGTEEPNDTYHFTDDLIIKISDSITAASVNWEDHMEFLSDAQYKTVKSYGTTFTIYTMEVAIDNPSDEKIYASITKFYVNDTPVSDDQLVASGNVSIYSGKTEKIYNKSTHYTWESTGETNIKKFGLRVKLTDEKGKLLYNNIQWLYLD